MASDMQTQTATPEGYYTSKYSGEEVDGLLDMVQQTQSNPNLLDNWHFTDPVNQQGKNVYTGITYTIDRWLLFSNSKTATLTLAAGHVTVASQNDVAQFIQRIELGCVPEGTKVVFSALTAAGLVSVTGTAIRGKGFSADAPWGSIDFRNLPRNAFWEAIISLNEGRSADIIAAKLEFGSTQTLAHQDANDSLVLNAPPPNKTLETIKCQRYFQVFSAESLRPTKAVDFRPPMLIDPTLGIIEINGITYYTANANL